MITLLKNGKLYDPAHNKDGVVEDIYMRDGHIIAKPDQSEKIKQTIDLTGKIVMAGAIDMHSHIGGGKVNIARMMLPEFRETFKYSEPEAHICTANCSHATINHSTPTTSETGCWLACSNFAACAMACCSVTGLPLICAETLSSSPGFKGCSKKLIAFAQPLANTFIFC